jgi:hypothetical protein
VYRILVSFQKPILLLNIAIKLNEKVRKMAKSILVIPHLLNPNGREKVEENQSLTHQSERF